MSSGGVKKEVKKEIGGDPGESPVVAVPTPKSSAKRAKALDFGLAEKWEDSRLIRDLVRENGRLVRWLSEEQINVINLETLGINSTLLCTVADFHCQRSSVVKAPSIDFLKSQVRGKKRVVEIQGLQVCPKLMFSFTIFQQFWIYTLNLKGLFPSAPFRFGNSRLSFRSPCARSASIMTHGPSKSSSVILWEGLAMTVGSLWMTTVPIDGILCLLH